MQSKLVEQIAVLRRLVPEPYRLALVMYPSGVPKKKKRKRQYSLMHNSGRGETQQHLLDQFHEFVHTPTLVQAQYLKRIFGAAQAKGSEVVVVTSQLPGLGKTEEIRLKAFQNHKTYVFITQFNCLLILG